MKITKEKLKNYLKITEYFFIDIFGWVCSLLILTFQRIKKPGIFYGYSAYWFATKYAEKRSKKWRPEWDQSGKQQGVLPFNEIKLLVCSKLELKLFKKLKLVNKKMKPRKLIKKSYYTTKL